MQEFKSAIVREALCGRPCPDSVTGKSSAQGRPRGPRLQLLLQEFVAIEVEVSGEGALESMPPALRLHSAAPEEDGDG